MSGGVNFTNNYDAFRNVQINGVNLTSKVEMTDEGVCKYKKAEPNREQTKSVRAAFAKAIECELTGTYDASKDGIFQSKKAAVDRSTARKEKFFSVMKAIGKYAALAIGTIATAGIGLVVYIENKRAQRELRDYAQSTAISNAFEIQESADIDDEDSEVPKVKANNPEKNSPVVNNNVEKGGVGAMTPNEMNEFIKGESDKFFKEIEKGITKKPLGKDYQNKDVVIDDDSELTLEEVTRVMDKVETFKTKRLLLEKANVNAFKGGKPGALYNNIKGYCKMLFEAPDKLEKDNVKKRFVDFIWENALSKLKWLSTGDLDRYKNFYASSLAEQMTFIIMTNDDTQEHLRVWNDDLNQQQNKLNGGGEYERTQETKSKMGEALVFALQNAIVKLNNDEVNAHKYR